MRLIWKLEVPSLAVKEGMLRLECEAQHLILQVHFRKRSLILYQSPHSEDHKRPGHDTSSHGITSPLLPLCCASAFGLISECFDPVQVRAGRRQSVLIAPSYPDALSPICRCLQSNDEPRSGKAQKICRINPWAASRCCATVIHVWIADSSTFEARQCSQIVCRLTSLWRGRTLFDERV